MYFRMFIIFSLLAIYHVKASSVRDSIAQFADRLVAMKFNAHNEEGKDSTSQAFGQEPSKAPYQNPQVYDLVFKLLGIFSPST